MVCYGVPEWFRFSREGLRSPFAHPGSPWLTLLARCEVLKRHGVGEREGEVGADFGVNLPSVDRLGLVVC